MLFYVIFGWQQERQANIYILACALLVRIGIIIQTLEQQTMSKRALYFRIFEFVVNQDNGKVSVSLSLSLPSVHQPENDIRFDAEKNRNKQRFSWNSDDAFGWTGCKRLFLFNFALSLPLTLPMNLVNWNRTIWNERIVLYETLKSCAKWK